MRRFFAALVWPLAVLTFALACPAAHAQTQAPETENAIIELSAAHGAGTPGTTDKVVVENARVIVRTPTSLGAGRFGWSTSESVYNITYRFDPATLRLVPETYTLISSSGSGGTGNTSGCANLNVQVVNSVVGSSAPIAGATIAIQSRTVQTDAAGAGAVTNLPVGQNLVTVSAAGYGTVTQAADLVCGANELSVALSPGAGSAGALAPGQFRVVLTWGRNPSDLDSHLTGPVTGSASRFHLYYVNRSTGGCGLDVDDVTSFGPETVTCPSTGSSGTTVAPGVFRYSVHHFSGSGNIGTSGAIVRLEQGDGTTQYFFPPSAGWTTETNVWTVFEITVAADGTTTVSTIDTIGTVTSEGSIP